MTLTILPNQNILDAVLVRYGSLEAAMAFCLSNNIPISMLPLPGTQFIAPAMQSSYEAEASNKYLHGNGIVIGTAGYTSCGLVSGLTVTAVTSTTATFTFAAGENGVGLQWAVVEGDTSPIPVDVHSISAEDTSVTIAGLNPEITYTFFIRTRCVGDASAWSQVSFTTAYSLTMTVILYPGLLNVNMNPGPIPGLSYPLIIHAEEITHVNDLAEPTYIATVGAYAKSDWDSGLGATYLLSNWISSPDHWYFDIPGPMISAEVCMWISATIGDGCAIQVADVEGYTAESIPFVLYSVATGTYVMQNVLSIGTGTTIGGSYHMPVTIEASGANSFFHVADYRIKRFDGGSWVDITGSLTAGVEYTIVLPPGIHKIGLFTTYQSSVLSAPIGPVSITSLVLQISA